jgi:hypothetical protein
MIRVSVDIFSGRPNPSWLVEEADAHALLKKVALQRSLLAEEPEPSAGGLGYRGMVVELLGEHLEKQYDLPAVFRLGAGGATAPSKGLELAQELVSGMLRAAPAPELADQPLAAVHDEALQKSILEQIAAFPPSFATIGEEVAEAALAEAPPAEGEPFAGAAVAAPPPSVLTCAHEEGTFNPKFWNDPTHQSRNNCYNYATNRRTDTFAQPGRASGHMYTALTCSAVTTAALFDGAAQRCQPSQVAPRWLIALVIWPGHDYHWYRKSHEGFWGHKPGGTAARNTDNNGKVILDPRTAARGPYTQFCGFFLAPKTMRVR